MATVRRPSGTQIRAKARRDPARAHDKVLRMARTIADLAGAADISPDHLSEASQYRRLDRRA